MDVVKVDRDVAYVVLVIHVCYKLLFSMFHFFQRMLQVCLSGCCICFHTYIASVLSECCVCLQWFKCFSGVFASISDACFKCFMVFRRMLQLLHLNVSKLDQMLHLSPRLLLPRLGARHGSKRKRRRSPLARVVPTCMRRRVAACGM
jgi:hypothetical protein